ncbi:MAG: LapA family protein [Synergistaceae bacterium]|nr:LapA family protein [Synergistaceae bacterium]
MLTYILAIAFSILLSAVYAFQNAGDIYVRFLVFERVFPQGVWEALLFSAGVLLMWIFSIFASLEGRAKYKSIIKEKDLKIAGLEEEKKSLLSAFNNLSPSPAGISAPVAPVQDEPRLNPAAEPASEDKKETMSV